MLEPDCYFGNPDAASEAQGHIVPNHVTRAWESGIKAFDRDTGKQVVVGIKGSGKTDVRKFIELSDSATVFNLDADHGYLKIDTGAIAGRSGVIKNALAVELLRAFSTSLSSDDATGLPGGVRKKLAKAGARAVELLQNIPDAVTIGGSFAQVDLAKLLSGAAAPHVSTAWKQSLETVLAAIGPDSHAYMMIDDLEDVFSGIEDNPPFLEGLFRATAEINAAAKRRLHALLFVKYGTWRRVYEAPQEYDKVKHVVGIIDWDRDALLWVIGRRIARIYDMPLDSDVHDASLLTELWAKEFAWKGQPGFDQLGDLITECSVGGPRDVVVLANLAKAAAGQSKIGVRHIKQVLAEYSEQKVYGLAADFGDVYREIQVFVERVMSGAPASQDGSKWCDLIEQKAMTDKRVDSQFQDYKWYRRASKFKLATILYEVGVLGLEVDETVVYSLERPRLSQSELVRGKLVVHPAFRPHLNIAGSG